MNADLLAKAFFPDQVTVGAPTEPLLAVADLADHVGAPINPAPPGLEECAEAASAHVERTVCGQYFTPRAMGATWYVYTPGRTLLALPAGTARQVALTLAGQPTPTIWSRDHGGQTFVLFDVPTTVGPDGIDAVCAWTTGTPSVPKPVHQAALKVGATLWAHRDASLPNSAIDAQAVAALCRPWRLRTGIDG